MPAYHTERHCVLYHRSHDAAYGRSLGGMVWPRGFVGAAIFWKELQRQSRLRLRRVHTA
jgi:hypothetical protein